MLLSLVGLFFAQQGVAQGLACNNQVQVSVSPTPNICEATITADMILEGPDPNASYHIKITHNQQVVVQGDDVVTISNASQYFGSTLVATITDNATGNSCWGTLTLEDKLAPVITCTDTTLNCADDLSGVLPPTAVDNCTPASLIQIQLTDEQTNTGNMCSGSGTIVRTYIAIDAQGNVSAPCQQVITIERPAPDEVDFPDDVMWTCDQYNAFPTIVDATSLHPFITDSDPSTTIIEVFLDENCDDNDAPQNDNPNVNSTNTTNGGNGCPGNGLDDADVLELTGSGIPENINGPLCNYQFSSSDQILASCGTSFKIVRTWTVLDWCTQQVVTSNANGEDNIQIIKVVDQVAPSISRPDFSVGVDIPGQHPQPCKSTGLLLPPTVSDNCNSVTVRIYTPIGEANYLNGVDGTNGGLIPAPGLPEGTHVVDYVAEDACGNITTIHVNVTVVDDKAPIAICDEITDVNLGSNGLAVVPADVFDDGSYDNCCLSHFQVRRMSNPCGGGTGFGPSVTFCCADVGTTVTVVFRAYDCSGNYNDCMVQVNVSDKLPPQVVSCPGPASITCDYYWENLEADLDLCNGDADCMDAVLEAAGFGTAEFFDNCDVDITRN
ncbi:MAG: hypothetical protein D6765_05330, partial [Bacteroidetes bacterium]